MTLEPIFSTCLQNWINSCLEACRRDVTTCCYHEARPHRTLQQRNTTFIPVKNAYHCHRCDDTNPDNFGSNCGTCLQCARDIQAEKNLEKTREYDRERKRAERAKSAIKPCRECGELFMSTVYDEKIKRMKRFFYCEGCRPRGTR